jgi:hypothetical protein
MHHGFRLLPEAYFEQVSIDGSMEIKVNIKYAHHEGKRGSGDVAPFHLTH